MKNEKLGIGSAYDRFYIIYSNYNITKPEKQRLSGHIINYFL